jgi:hypothetical protein
MSILVGAPAPRQYAHVNLAAGAVPEACNNRVLIESFLHSFAAPAPNGSSAFFKPNQLVCNRDATPNMRSTFEPVKLLGKGSYGSVWLYKKTSGPAPLDAVCLKIITSGSASAAEEAAIAHIRRVNKTLVGLPDVGCEVINARVLLRQPITCVIMRRADGSLEDLSGHLMTSEALGVARAMAAEALNTVTVYNLYNTDLKPANYLYTVKSADLVEVCVADLGSLCEPGKVIDITTFRWPQDYRDKNQVNEEFMVYQLAASLACLSQAASSADIRNASGRAHALQAGGSDLKANRAFRAALAYGLQCDLRGALIPNAGSTGTTIAKFIDALGSGDNQTEHTLSTLRGNGDDGRLTPSDLRRMEDTVSEVRAPGTPPERAASLINQLSDFAIKQLLAYMQAKGLKKKGTTKEDFLAVILAEAYIPAPERARVTAGREGACARALATSASPF